MSQKASGGGGGKAAGNSSITSFFKPVERSKTPPRAHSQPPSQTGSQTPSKTPQSSRHARFISPSPIPHSSPVSRAETPALPGGRVIDASDDSDGGFSDDSLEDLSMLLGRGRSVKQPEAPQAQHNLYATPRAKRTAVEFHSSPLAFIPKHKFDLKALAKDAQRDNATQASSVRVKDAAKARESEAAAAAAAAAKEESANAFVDIVKGKSGHDAQKVLRAVQRTEPGQSELRYCFFDTSYKLPTSSPTPKKVSTGPWRLLTQGSARLREEHLISGLPQTILRKNGGLPDELFDWILDELCIQKSIIVRREYCNLITSCPDQIGRLLTPYRLDELFIRLGASEDLRIQDLTLDISKKDEEPYKDRDWSCLQSFLALLALVAGTLSVESVVHAARCLLRLSFDKVVLCNMDILMDYEDAIHNLVCAIPRTSWNSFCLETCLMLHVIIKPQCIRANALLCIPVDKPQLHDLRRRLAATFLFRDPKLGGQSPEDVITLRDIINCLDREDFAINAKTDFAELKASVILLDIAVDDGSVAALNNPEDEKKFNAEVDELAVRLREVWRKINDSGMKLARTEAKSVFEWVQQRLSHSVRTKKQVKKSIFDIPGQTEDPFLPRQRDYMKKFLNKDPKEQATGEDSIVAKGG